MSGSWGWGRHVFRAGTTTEVNAETVHYAEKYLASGGHTILLTDTPPKIRQRVIRGPLGKVIPFVNDGTWEVVVEALPSRELDATPARTSSLWPCSLCDHTPLPSRGALARHMEFEHRLALTG